MTLTEAMQRLSWMYSLMQLMYLALPEDLTWVLYFIQAL